MTPSNIRPDCADHGRPGRCGIRVEICRLGGASRPLLLRISIGNKLLTLASNMFTNLNLRDMETCYKVFRREIDRAITIEEDRFGFEPEITAKVAGMNARIYEVAISYHGRTILRRERRSVPGTESGRCGASSNTTSFDDAL